MLKLLIVDDEILVRMGLKSTINWGELGFEIVGEADNGEKALELCRLYCPDIVITDIRMPKMDGITLMKKVREELPETKFIALSCYNELDIVREAMQFYGALDYIPKLSMLPEDLIATMEKVKRIIGEEKSREQELRELRDIGKNQASDYSTLLCELIDSPDDQCEALAARLEELLPIDHQAAFEEGRQYQMIYVCMDGGDSALATDRMKSILEKGINTSLEKEGLPGRGFCRAEREYGIFLLTGKQDASGRGASVKGKDGTVEAATSTMDKLDAVGTEPSANGKGGTGGAATTIIEKHSVGEMEPYAIEKLCRNILSWMKRELGLSTSFGISELSKELSRLGEAYRQAMASAGLRIYSGRESISFYGDYKKLNHNDYFTRTNETSLREFVENGEYDKAAEMLGEILGKIRQDGRVHPEKIQDQLQEILYTLSSVAKQYHGSIHEVKDEKGREYVKGIRECQELKEIEEWFRGFLYSYIEYIGRLKKNRFGTDISRVLEYMNVHYSEDLKLSDIARHVALNETYLSHLFKRSTSYSITEYLNIIRINKAKECLKDKSVNVYRVAEQVGYANESYFSKVFKQYTGMTPKEYKNQK